MGKNNSKQSSTDNLFPDQSDVDLLKDLLLQCLTGEDDDDIASKRKLQKQDSTSSTITQGSMVNYFLEQSLCIMEMPCGDFQSLTHNSSWLKSSPAEMRKKKNLKKGKKPQKKGKYNRLNVFSTSSLWFTHEMITRERHFCGKNRHKCKNSTIYITLHEILTTLWEETILGLFVTSCTSSWGDSITPICVFV